MARPVPTPYVPGSAPIVRNGFAADVWLLFFNKVVEFIATLTQRGLRADQPAATSVYPGTLYYVTDEAVTEKSNGNIWQDYTDGAGGIGAAAPPDTSVQTNQGGNLSGSIQFTYDPATGKVRILQVDDNKDPLGIIPRTGLVATLTFEADADIGGTPYQQIGFGIEDFIATDPLPAYLYKQATGSIYTDGAGVELLTSEVVGNPLTYASGVGFAFATALRRFIVYQYGGLGAGAVPGLSVQVGANSSGNGAASTLNLQQRAGTDYLLWFDALKRLRKGTSRPTEDNSVSDTAGTPVNDRMANPPLTTPANLEDGDSWLEASGVSPARNVKLYLRDGGVSVLLQTWTY